MDKGWCRVAVFLLGLTSIISGCNSGRIQPPDSPRQIEATVPGWTLGEAVVVALAQLARSSTLVFIATMAFVAFTVYCG
ncbi:MAG: hypothetical protein JSV66_06260 [Trueperaceae bacterium]|nr:MAG: hypothetical protein JSV66_06260 [Trueperaceae bacterium]